MGYSAQRHNVLLCLAALEAALRAEGWKSEPGAGVAAAVAHYTENASAV
jgi:(S)-ureidoglycine-glyoxylate aminotransferase